MKAITIMAWILMTYSVYAIYCYARVLYAYESQSSLAKTIYKLPHTFSSGLRNWTFVFVACLCWIIFG